MSPFDPDQTATPAAFVQHNLPFLALFAFLISMLCGECAPSRQRYLDDGHNG